MSDNYENEDEVESVLNIGNRNSKWTFHGSRSRVGLSRTASAYIKAQGEVAALMVLQNLLQQRHALDEQEEEQEEELRKKKEQLRKKREQLEMEVEIAASRAKMNVLRRSGRRGAASDTSVSPNGKQSYFGN